MKSSPEIYDNKRDKFTVKAKIYKIELVGYNNNNDEDEDNDDDDDDADNDDNDDDEEDNKSLIVDIDRLKI